MTALDWVQVLTLGALLGASGQIVRAMAGLKKLNDDVSRKGQSFADAFSPSCMVVSILIGAVAGMLGVISLGINPNNEIGSDKVIAVLGIGYAGADFIEAFMAQNMPGKSSAAGSKNSSLPGNDMLRGESDGETPNVRPVG